MKTKQFTYREMVLSSSQVEVPRQTYQRNFNAKRAQKIADEFDERIANEPKVSYRDGRYFVFDGQHTIAARKLLNNGEDVSIKCRVYFGMTEQDEALLFAQQFGVSARFPPALASVPRFSAATPSPSLFWKPTRRLGFSSTTTRNVAETVSAVSRRPLTPIRKSGRNAIRKPCASSIPSGTGNPIPSVRKMSSASHASLTSITRNTGVTASLRSSGLWTL